MGVITSHTLADLIGEIRRITDKYPKPLELELKGKKEQDLNEIANKALYDLTVSTDLLVKEAEETCKFNGDSHLLKRIVSYRRPK